MRFLAVLSLSLCVSSAAAFGQAAPMAPPMGWNSWNHFAGHVTSPDMMVSLTMLCSPLNGSPLVYMLGAREDKLGSLRVGYGGWCIARIAHVYEYLGLNIIFDLHVDHWGWRNEFGTGPLGLESTDFDGFVFVSLLLWLYAIVSHMYVLVSRFDVLCRNLVVSPCYDKLDNLPYGAAPVMAAEFNAQWQPSKRSWYRSYAASIEPTLPPRHQQLNLKSWILTTSQMILARWIRKAVARSVDLGKSINMCSQCQTVDDWLKGDGVVPLPSQYHPRCCW